MKSVEADREREKGREGMMVGEKEDRRGEGGEVRASGFVMLSVCSDSDVCSGLCLITLRPLCKSTDNYGIHHTHPTRFTALRFESSLRHREMERWRNGKKNASFASST